MCAWFGLNPTETLYNIILSTDNMIEGFSLEQGETMNLHLLPELALRNPLLTPIIPPPPPPDVTEDATAQVF
jgi:hypothetical protein